AAGGTATSRHRLERVHDTHRGAQQADERRGCTDGAQHARTALELGQRDHHLALDRALGRVDVGGGDRGTVTEQRLHLGQGTTQHPGDVRALALLGQRDRLVEVLLLDRARELRRELAGRGLALLHLDVLLEGDRERVDRHDRQGDDDALCERAGDFPEMKQIGIHRGTAFPWFEVLTWALADEGRHEAREKRTVCWTSWRTGWPRIFAGENRDWRITSIAACSKALLVELTTWIEFASTRPLVPTTNRNCTTPSMPMLRITSGYRGSGPPMRCTCSSTSSDV